MPDASDNIKPDPNGKNPILVEVSSFGTFGGSRDFGVWEGASFRVHQLSARTQSGSGSIKAIFRGSLGVSTWKTSNAVIRAKIPRRK
ncbi:hypothetical protein EON65_29310 [archaeon]|nr:MAG: hypothetical protein EON65_29310 [archaeon]